MARKHISTVLISLLFSTPAVAEEDVEGANILGMGGAAVAHVSDNSAITVNPGLMGLTRRYDFHGHYKLGPSGGSHWAATAMDGQTSKFLWMGLAYSGDVFRPELETSELPGWKIPGQEIENTKRFHEFTLALSVPLVRERVALGVNGAMSLYNHDRQGRGIEGSADVGLGLRPLRWLSIGLVGENLLPLENERTAGGQAGIRVFDETVGAIEVDGGYRHAENDGLGFGLGAEKNAGMSRLRLGYEIDLPEMAQRASWGIGLVGEGGSFEYGMAIPVGGGEGLAGLVNQLSIHLKAPDTSASSSF